jgi:hypothetical protein
MTALCHTLCTRRSIENPTLTTTREHQEEKTKPTAMLKSCSRIPLLQLTRCLKAVRPYFQRLLSLHVTDRHVLSLDVLLPVGVLSSYSALPCQDTHCQMIHEKLRTNSMRSDVREWTHFVVVNKPCSHLNSFCAAGVSSGLATEVTLIECNGEVGRNYYAGADLLPKCVLHAATVL